MENQKIGEGCGTNAQAHRLPDRIHQAPCTEGRMGTLVSRAHLTIKEAPALGDTKRSEIVNVMEKLRARGLDGNAEAAILHTEMRGVWKAGGLDVLEIGGAPGMDLEGYFEAAGAKSYVNVRLEPNSTLSPKVVQGNYMGMDGTYDLIVAMGVFEPFAIDRKQSDMIPTGGVESMPEEGVFENKDRLQKLFGLLKEGGALIIGTISLGCIFSNKEIEDAGFCIQCRRGDYGILRGWGELLVLHKMPKAAGSSDANLRLHPINPLFSE